MKMMTRLINAFCLVAFCAIVQVSGQERAITEKQLNDARTSASEALKSKIYRTKTEASPGSGPEHFFTISEYVPPDRSRLVRVYTFKDKVEKSEIIEIGDRSYARFDGGPWISPYVPNDRYTVSGNQGEAKVERKFEYTLAADRDLGKEKANLYVETENFSYEAPGVSYKTVSVIRYWISKGGLFLRSEETVHDKDGKSLHRSTVDYEYDPGLKIEAPLVKPAKVS
jgi:hypothetical protein